MNRPLFALAVCFVTACGSSEEPADLSGPDLVQYDIATVDLTPTDLADYPSPPDLAGADIAGYPAPHEPFPLLKKHDGAIIEHTRLVTVTYDDYPYRAMVEDWGDFIFDSNWWYTVATEYGSKGGSHLAKVHIPGNAPTTVTTNQLLDKLDEMMDAGLAPNPLDTVGEQVLFQIYLGKDTQIDDGIGGKSCYDYFGFHSNWIHGGILFPYSIVMDCDTYPEDITSTAGHELVEATTNPFSAPREGWYRDEGIDSHYYTEGLGENADLCNEEDYYWEQGHAMQPVFSNKAAMAGLPPCVPNNGWPFFGMDVQPAVVPLANPGETVVFTVTGWSMFPRGDWSVDIAETLGSSFQATSMNATLSAKKLNNGKSVTLSLTVPATAKSGQIGAVDIFATLISSRSAPASFRVP